MPLLILVLTFASSFAQAAVDWNDVPMEYLPNTTQIAITDGVRFSPGDQNFYLGRGIRHIHLVMGTVAVAVDCSLELKEKSKVELSLAPPITFQVTKVAKLANGEYFISTKSHTDLVSGFRCVSLESWDLRKYGRTTSSNVGEFIELISQFGKVELGPQTPIR